MKDIIEGNHDLMRHAFKEQGTSLPGYIARAFGYRDGNLDCDARSREGSCRMYIVTSPFKFVRGPMHVAQLVGVESGPSPAQYSPELTYSQVGVV
jgi:hypothetical protein